MTVQSGNADLKESDVEEDRNFSWMDPAMAVSQGRAGRRVRALFLSDLHLGCRYARADACLALLKRCRPEYLYLVGDIIDGWRLRRRWFWRPEFSSLLLRLLQLSDEGTKILYTPGNHDEFARRLPLNLGFVEIADQFVHETAAGQYYLVTHGDRFDDVERRARWLSRVGGAAYETLLWLNHLLGGVQRRLGLRRWSLSAAVKFRVKQAVRFISGFERRLARHARALGCDGVICGHIHAPTITQYGGIRYCNSGDWIENCSALVEYEDGELALVFAADGAADDAPLPPWEECPALYDAAALPH